MWVAGVGGGAGCGGAGGGGCGAGVGGGARFPGSARSSPALIAHHPDSSSDSQIRPSKRCDWPPPPPPPSPPPPAAPTASRIAPSTSRIWLSSRRTRSSGSQSQNCQRFLVVLGGSASSPSTSIVESHLMRDPIKMQSACTQHAIRMHSAGTLQALCRHSAGTQQALSRHSAGTLQALSMQSVELRIAPAQQDALARNERRLGRTTMRAAAMVRSPSRVPSGLVRVGA